ncbi:MAG: helix-turn-helix domain-containing protein [Lysobacterales bacterium]|nr:helix-turn-helix domain-containing protein [Xanthomonadales bacterium]
MKISDAAAASGCHLETIRYYERVGLLPPPARTPGRYRQYGDADVERLRFVARGRELGFSLDEIRSLLRLAKDPVMSCGEVDQIARQHLEDIRLRINDLKRMAVELERTINSCGGGQRGVCTILDALRQPLAPQTR